VGVAVRLYPISTTPHSTAIADEGQGLVTPSKAGRQDMQTLKLLLILANIPVALPAAGCGTVSHISR
jgi:hypothetical protein